MSGDKLQQQVRMIEHSVCTCRVTSCSNKSWRQITLCVQVEEQVAATSLGNRSLCVYRSRNKLQQQVMMIEHSVCAGRATTCSNKSCWQITPCVQVGQLVAATHCCETSQRQMALCVLENFCKKIFVSATEFVAATSHTNSVWFDFLWHVATTRCWNKSPSVYRP